MSKSKIINQAKLKAVVYSAPPMLMAIGLPIKVFVRFVNGFIRV